jgi:ATP-binding cassette subfamily B (MDR/TAP) protein 1
VAKLESGIGDKLGLFCQFTSTFITGIIVGFVYSWKLAGVIVAVSPLLALSGMLMSRVGYRRNYYLFSEDQI